MQGIAGFKSKILKSCPREFIMWEYLTKEIGDFVFLNSDKECNDHREIKTTKTVKETQSI